MMLTPSTTKAAQRHLQRSVRNARTGVAVQQIARLHDGKATYKCTHSVQPNQMFENEEGITTHAVLRVSKKQSAKDHSKPLLAVTPIGVGDPYCWAKQVPRIDAAKELILSKQSNFIQARFNPFQPGVLDPQEQVYPESVALSELVMVNELDRHCVVVSALIDDDMFHQSMLDAHERMSPDVISSAVKTALIKWDVLTLDHLTYRLPQELVVQADWPKTQRLIAQAANTLQEFCQQGKLQSFGFGLPRELTESGNEQATNRLNSLLDCLDKGSSHHDGFTSLQYTTNLSSGIPLPQSLKQFCESKKLLRIGENVFNARLANGKPFRLKKYIQHNGQELAAVLKKSFDLSINLELKYHETLMNKFQERGLVVPPMEEVAWGHSLANQYEQFDNTEEWNYMKNTQVLPRLEQLIQSFKELEDDETTDFAFAYSVVVNDLLKNFGLSLELQDAWRAADLVDAIDDVNCKTLEEIALVAALSGNADVVLLEHPIENLEQLVEISQDRPFAPTQLNVIERLTHKHFQNVNVG